MTDVIVIGAGLSGLHAAWMLESQGLSVKILEGRERVGGRVHTLDDVPGKPEAGGNGIGPSYARVLDWVQRLGIELVPVRIRSDPGFLETVIHWRGQLIHEKNWKESALNPFPEDMKAKKPWDLQWTYFLADNPLKDLEAWRDPKHARFDISIHEFAKSKGLSDDAIMLGFDRAGLYGTSAFDVSLLGMYQIFALANHVRTNFSNESYAIKGGNQRLPEAIAQSLKTEIIMNRPVAAIRSEERAVEVRCRGGQVYRAKWAVVTAPFPALRGVLFDPVLSEPQADAVAHLGYSVGYQVHFVPTRKFWQDDGLPITMWTDGLVGRLAPLYYGDSETEPTTIISFVNGARALHLDRMSEPQAIQAIQETLVAMRPSIKGALKPVKVQSWQRDPFAGGVYSSWQPGQITRFANVMSTPAGRIHFAGEHTAQLVRGMEGAMESGERAAIEILNQT
ncbi:MAG: NAD(P)/FAD-dependent oxidoreductase [Rhodospirillaceae bacterium]|nr:NAD(P)/FAD-dependent oxidoreductase [Rhodospirillaceae bacterium]